MKSVIMILYFTLCDLERGNDGSRSVIYHLNEAQRCVINVCQSGDVKIGGCRAGRHIIVVSDYLKVISARSVCRYRFCQFG
jgi:hypothetical protein